MLSAESPDDRWWALVAGITTTLVLVRLGLLAQASMMTMLFASESYPVTYDLSTPYAPATVVALLVVTGIAAFGLYTSLGGRPFSRWTMLSDL